MLLYSLIQDMMLDEEISGNVDISVWEALDLIKSLSKQYKLSFREEHVINRSTKKSEEIPGGLKPLPE